MNPFETILSTVASLFPDASLAVTRPKQDGGVWSLDIDLGDNNISIEWESATGFGISTVRPESYGEGPDEIYPDEVTALTRLTALLRR